MSKTNEADVYTRAMFGERAVHVAFNMIIQGGEYGDPKAALIGNTVYAQALRFGANKNHSHVLVLCDAIVRPRIVISSNHFRGHGAAGLLTSSALASVDEWVRHGTVIIQQ